MQGRKLYPIMLLRTVLLCISLYITGVLALENELGYTPTVRSKSSYPQHGQRHASINDGRLTTIDILKIFPDGVYLTAPTPHILAQTRHTLTSRDIHWV